jgi:predicted ATPase
MGQRVSCPVLVGRDGEVARLRAAIERAAAGQPATVLVAGEAGIGKTGW